MFSDSMEESILEEFPSLDFLLRPKLLLKAIVKVFFPGCTPPTFFFSILSNIIWNSSTFYLEFILKSL